MKVESRLQDRHKKVEVASKLSSLIFTLSTFLFLTACSEVLYLSVEQMVPPEVMPAKTARSIGVVNNFSQHNVIIVNEDAVLFPCDADSVKEQVALSFADAGVLDRVVVLDSLLYPAGGVAPHILTQTEVNALCARLDVGMLYSVDYACVTTNTATPGVGRPVNAYLCSRIYLPDADTLSVSCTIDKKSLEYWAYDTAEVRLFVPLVPQLLAEEAIEPCLPAWKERERVFYYDRLCYPLREAKVYVREGNWEGAAAEWRTMAGSKQRLRRFESAYNMALYYEMTDSIDQAIASLDLAAQLAMKKNHKTGATEQAIDTTLVGGYRTALVRRKQEIEKIDRYFSQMGK